MRNYELWKFADVVSDIIIDYCTGKTDFTSDREVLDHIEDMCMKTMDELEGVE